MSLRGVGSEPPFPGDFRLLTPGPAGSHCCSMGRAAGSAHRRARPLDPSARRAADCLGRSSCHALPGCFQTVLFPDICNQQVPGTVLTARKEGHYQTGKGTAAARVGCGGCRT